MRLEERYSRQLIAISERKREQGWIYNSTSFPYRLLAEESYHLLSLLINQIATTHVNFSLPFLRLLFFSSSSFSFVVADAKLELNLRFNNCC